MNIDLLPTVLAAAGLEPPRDRIIDGLDLLSLLEGAGPRPDLEERTLYFFHEYDVEAMRRGRWKYIANNSHYTWPVPLDKSNTLVGRAAGGRDYLPADGSAPVPTLGTWPLLYDLSLDREEAYNLADRHPDTVARMGRDLAAWHAAFMQAPRGWKY